MLSISPSYWARFLGLNDSCYEMICYGFLSYIDVWLVIKHVFERVCMGCFYASLEATCHRVPAMDIISQVIHCH